eukprot:g17189.t1
MVGATAPPPSQPAEVGHQDTARGPAVSSSTRSRISMSEDFLYGKVEVRAKVAHDGFSGFWLKSSEESAIGHMPCARVTIAEIRETKGDIREPSTWSATASMNFGDLEKGELGCTSSDASPREGVVCSLPSEDGTDWSDDFHVYALEWEEEEFRWYVDGLHYCTKTSWFASHPDDFPAPFDKALRFDMGVEAVGDPSAGEIGGGENGGPSSSSAMRPEMIVDYVRIAQGPNGLWAPPTGDIPEGGFPLDADGGVTTSPPPRAVDIFNNILAVLACVLGPYMAMTGLRRPRTNTILMGVEIGAFKAANAAYFLFRSYVMALASAVICGLFFGFVAIRHRAMARWNTVAGLAIPALFLLIDVGMISDIGSRYVCWAIFFVLTVTFAVLVFPSEHHAAAFAVASAATGSCVLKLGAGWLLGESGEIFKILDDPLGDRCHLSRVCKYLNFVMGAVFLIGLCSQWILRPSCNDKAPGGNGERSLEKEGRPLFTPPRARYRWRGAVVRSGAMSVTRRSTAAADSDFDVQDGRETSSDTAGEREPALGAVDRGGGLEQQQGKQRPEDDDTLSEGYDDDEAFILGLPGARRGGGGVWQRITSGARRFLDRMLQPISSYRHHQVPASAPLDSPTPVPMPPSGPESNTVVSNQGDTIELVIHSPHKGSLGHRQPPGWLGSGSGGGGGGGGNHRHPLPPFSQTDGEGDGGPRRRLKGMTAGSTSSSDDYDDVLSILSASELVAADDLHLPASAVDVHAECESATANEGALSGRLVNAFADKWEAWVQEARSSDDGSADGRVSRRRGRHTRGGVRSARAAAFGKEGGGGGGGGSSGGGRNARDFDHEALVLSPYVPPPTNFGRGSPSAEAGTRGGGESQGDPDRRATSHVSFTSSSSSVYDERWVWRSRDGVLTSSSNGSSGRASSHGGLSVAAGQDLLPGDNIFDSATGGGTSSRGESERGSSSGTSPAEVVSVNAEATASAGVPLDAEGAQGASGGSTAASLREIDL